MGKAGKEGKGGRKRKRYGRKDRGEESLNNQF